MRGALLMFLLAVSTVAVAAPFSPNVIPDPGFEQRAWNLTSWEVCEHKEEYVGEAHAGQVAVKLSGIKRGKDDRISSMAISPALKLEGGRAYLLALWYRTDPEVSASVSVLTYKEPFATAQWKTPRASYDTLTLPASTTWRLWTHRYVMPVGAVEVIIAPRLGTVGNVWFDDISLLPADQGSITFGVNGRITKLPDTRRYEAGLTLPEGTACELRAYGPDGGLVQSLKADQRLAMTLAVPAGQSRELALVEKASGAIIAVGTLAAPPLADFTLTYPNYRKTFYAGLDRSYLTGILGLHASADVLKKATLTTTLKAPDGTETTTEASPVLKPLAGQRAVFVPEEITLRQRMPKEAAPGAYEFTVTLTASDGPHRFTQAFRVVPPARAGVHEFIVGPRNELLCDGQPFFPRGFMGGAADVYGPVVKAGYNVGHSFGGSVESQIRWLDGLQQIGMYGITGVLGTFVSKGDVEGLRAAVRQMRSHPALLGYYFPDEPSPSTKNAAPADWQPLYDVMVEEDPYHPVMTTMYNAEFAPLYENVLDILMFDPYPITFQRRPLTMVSDYILRARELTHDRKPVWCVPQAFGWDVVEGLEGDPTWTTPTPAQARCMSYLALAAGARGLVYYCYHVYTQYDKAKKEAGGWPWVLGGYLPEKQPALWGALAKVGEELKLLAPALDRPARMWQEGPMFLREIMPAGQEPGYLIAVNGSEDKPAEATVKLQSRLPKLFELEEIERRTCCVTIAGNEAHLKLEAMQVGIWKLPGE
jgi:hypothetical protein